MELINFVLGDVILFIILNKFSIIEVPLVPALLFPFNRILESK